MDPTLNNDILRYIKYNKHGKYGQNGIGIFQAGETKLNKTNTNA